jgi:hypothetical protein
MNDAILLLFSIFLPAYVLLQFDGVSPRVGLWALRVTAVTGAPLLVLAVLKVLP